MVQKMDVSVSVQSQLAYTDDDQSCYKLVQNLNLLVKASVHRMSYSNFMTT